jgi:hypothetical protein
VVIAAHKTTTVEMELAEVRREDDGPKEGPGGGGRDARDGGGEPRSGGSSSSFQVYGGRPLADLRLGIDPFDFFKTPNAEVGFGAEWPYVRAALHLRFLPTFGVIPRGGLWVPVVDQVRAFVELELPVYFPQGTTPLSLGLGGCGGAELFFIKWLSGFAEIGARNFFLPDPRVEVTIQAGMRMRLP